MTAPIGPRRNPRATPTPLEPPPGKKTSTGSKGVDAPAPRPQGLAAHAEDVVVPSRPDDMRLGIGSGDEVPEPRAPSTEESTGKRAGAPTVAGEDADRPGKAKPRLLEKGPPPPVVPGRPPKAGP